MGTESSLSLQIFHKEVIALVATSFFFFFLPLEQMTAGSWCTVYRAGIERLFSSPYCASPYGL